MSGIDIRNRGTNAPSEGWQGAVWQTVVFAAGDYTAGGAMTWTVASGDVITHRYLMIGPNTMLLEVAIELATIVAVVDADCLLNIPNNKRAVRRSGGSISITDNSVNESGRYAVAVAGTNVVLSRQGGSVWTAVTNGQGVEFTIEIEVEERP